MLAVPFVAAPVTVNTVPSLKPSASVAVTLAGNPGCTVRAVGSASVTGCR